MKKLHLKETIQGQEIEISVTPVFPPNLIECSPESAEWLLEILKERATESRQKKDTKSAVSD